MSAVQDLRLASRLLWKSRGATALSILSIALGIGLTTGIFSVEDAVLLRPLPVADPSGLLYSRSVGDDGRTFQYSWPDYEDMAQAGAKLGNFAAYSRRILILTRADETTMLLATPATPNYLSLLGVKAELGCASLADLDGRPAAVLGRQVWIRVFGSDERIVGKSIVLNGKAFTVAGVMPGEFGGLNRGVANDAWISTDAWLDILHSDSRTDRSTRAFEIVARLKPGVTPDRTAAQLDAAIRGPGKHKPAPQGARGTVLTADFAPEWTRDMKIGGISLLVFGLILFVACANVAQLRLAQAEARRRELAIRFAMGSGAWRVLRQLLIESGIVALAGGAIGIVLARAVMIKAAQFISSGQAFIDFGIRLDHRVLMYTLAATVFSVLLTGVAPARHALRLNLAEVLKSEQGATGARAGWQKQLLVGGQVAVTVVFFGMAVLSIQSLRSAMAIRPGLDPQKKLFIMEVSRGARMPVADWCQQVTERLAGIPGVRGATYARRLPLSGSGGGATARVEVPGQAPLGVHYNNVGGNYFAVMGTRILAGRAIDANDRKGDALVMVASQAFARQVFGEGNPLGQWVSVNGKARQIVGIAEDANSNDVHEPPEPFLYFPFAQMPSGDLSLMVETAAEPAAMAQAIRKEVKQFDRGAVIFSGYTLREHMERALTEDWLMVTLTIVLGAFGVLLTAAGLFGVLQFGVNRRTREMGLRMALGATPQRIQGLILKDSLRVAAAGGLFGIVLLGLAAKYMHSLVPMASVFDPAAYFGSGVSAAAIALASGWLPARRATRVDPAAALRSE